MKVNPALLRVLQLRPQRAFLEDPDSYGVQLKGSGTGDPRASRRVQTPA